jgi:hypothetical protein
MTTTTAGPTPKTQAFSGIPRSDAAVTRSDNAHGAPLKLQKRIGSTLYIVTAYTGPNATETMEDKILRLIEREVNKSA